MTVATSEITTSEKDEAKAMVLLEIEKMFTHISEQLNVAENHDKMLFLMDVEKALKEALMGVN